MKRSSLVTPLLIAFGLGAIVFIISLILPALPQQPLNPNVHEVTLTDGTKCAVLLMYSYGNITCGWEKGQ